MFASVNMNDDTTAMLILLPIAGLFVLVLLVGLGLVIRGTVRRKGNWGINLKLGNCPCCGEPTAPIRVPKNLRQALWGGSTCHNCGLEYDKWGNAVDENDLRRRHDEFADVVNARFQPRQPQPDDRTTPPGRIT